MPLRFTLQGQCKPNAESSLYAEVQPVLADFIGKIIKKKWLKVKTCDRHVDHVFNFSSEFNTQIENFSSENATFPQNDGKLFRRASQN
jgi:hypothetical protein